MMITKKFTDLKNFKRKEGVYMFSKSIGRSALLAGSLLLSMAIVGIPANEAKAANGPGGHVRITEVSVDFVLGVITITGEDFDFGNNLQVTLGEIGDITDLCQPDFNIPHQIECNFSDNALPADGDYLLTVSTGNGQSQNDEYDLSIGAVGPQGDQGPQGKLGDTGPQGEQGKIGPQGDQGPQGKLGSQGPQGPQGPQGEQGEIGPQGLSYPASVVTDSAAQYLATVTNIDLNGHTITGTCSPSGNISLNFDWTLAYHSSNIHQINVGFVGGDTRCIASNYALQSQSGSESLTLSCPDTPGPHLLGVRNTHCYGCTNCNYGEYHAPPGPNTPGYSVTANGNAFIGVVNVQ